MASMTKSFFVQYKHDSKTGYTHLEVVQVESAKKVQLRNGSFLLRISVDEETFVVRCHIRHIASGREAYVQGGQSLYAFITFCLLNEGIEDEVAERETDD